MASFSPNDRKAIKWFFKNNTNFRPALTHYPLVAWEVDGKRFEKEVMYIRRQWENRNVKKQKAHA